MSKLNPDVVPDARVRVKIKATDAGETTTGELVGTVEQVDDTSVPLKLRGYGWVASDVIESVEVLARPRMAEPPAGTTVRHAGSIFVRPLGQVQPDRTPWMRVDRRNNLGGCRWATWAEVLELDTANEPEVIDPRPTPEPEVGTVVRHAGAVFARPNRRPGYIASAPLARWLPVRGADHAPDRTWWTWAQVLELDPAHAPEIVEL